MCDHVVSTMPGLWSSDKTGSVCPWRIIRAEFLRTLGWSYFNWDCRWGNTKLCLKIIGTLIFFHSFTARGFAVYFFDNRIQTHTCANSNNKLTICSTLLSPKISENFICLQLYLSDSRSLLPHNYSRCKKIKHTEVNVSSVKRFFRHILSKRSKSHNCNLLRTIVWHQHMIERVSKSEKRDHETLVIPNIHRTLKNGKQPTFI